jgi:AcrR family transcriptional regulator
VPGPSPSLDLDQIVDAAVALADAGGLEGLSMRKVGSELGVAAMALYRYVHTKDELIDAMIDRVLGEFPVAESPDWRDAMRLEGQRLRNASLAHPWVVGLLLTRPSFGHNLMTQLEQSMAMLDGIGLDIDQMLDVGATVRTFTVGYVQAELAEAETQRRTGMTEAEWRETIAPIVEALIATGDFPYVERVVIDAEDYPDSDVVFNRRLEHVLDGLQVLVDRVGRSKGPKWVVKPSGSRARPDTR